MKSLVFSNNEGLVLKESTESPQSSLVKEKALIEVHYSGINYKDALGVCGNAPIFKNNPIVPGIDMSGIALNGKYQGQKVIAQGCNIGEIYDGGYTQEATVEESLIIPLPKGLTLEESMTLGTAGFTAALAFHRMEQNGQSPDKGPILISGATGGVGGFATQIFSQKGYDVSVVTHRDGFDKYLKGLGANNIYKYDQLFSEDSKPLEKIKWGGVVDNLGGGFLESTLPQVALWGNVCSIGLAKGAMFKTSVMPFILRGVSLLGVSSNNCTMDLRKSLWARLGDDLKPRNLLNHISSRVSLEGVLEASKKILEHQSQGRVLVEVKSS
jgi:putative YhdH/YhfP family quinone oxidoreductase